EVELYARPGNEVYACGSGDDCRLSETVDDVQVDSVAIERVIRDATSISPELRNGKIDKRQACFLPVIRSGGGPIDTHAGRRLEPGKEMAELVLDGKVTCTSLKKLDPSRFL
ncbi:hypothetical protein MPER_13167, partial [Moniliophthora perniciosa FA553]